jgi:predicted RNase H-like HicB family nuclease
VIELTGGDSLVEHRRRKMVCLLDERRADRCWAARCYSRGEASMSVTFEIELDREADGRWIAEVPDLPGVMTYGQTRDEAVARVQALALRVLADRLEHNEAPPELLAVTFHAA